MQLAIFNKENAVQYDMICGELGIELDIYYSSAYLQHEAIYQKSPFEIFFIRKESSVFIYPFLKKKLPEVYGDYYDISSSYGYCGPFTNDPALLDEAEDLLLAYCREQRIVTEFVRYHYLYNRNILFKKNISNIPNRTVVTLNTAQDWDNIWAHQFSGINRNLVRKLEKEGYIFERVDFGSHIDQFTEMYHATMQNVNADDQYFFSREYFLSLYNALRDRIFMCKVGKGGEVYAMSLFFSANGILTYFLSARNIHYPKVPASNLLLSKMAEQAHLEGYKIMNFGGGLTDKPEDSLFRFKSNFSKDTSPFVIGKRTHFPDVYEAIGRRYREIKQGQQDTATQVLQYYHNI